MTYIERFFRKTPSEVITEEDLTKFLEKAYEESLNLEYKHSNKLNGGTVDLTKTISSFANSEGGLLIIGISEREENNRRLPGEITWDSNPSHTKEWVEEMTLNKIRPRIDARISIVNSASGQVFLIDVSQSSNPPHMAADNRYYQRHNFSTDPMEHYQVADYFGKRRRPILSPSIQVSNFTEDKNIVLQYGIDNKGHASAKWPMFLMNGVFRAWGPDPGIIGQVAEEVPIPGEGNRKRFSLDYCSQGNVIHPKISRPIGRINIGLRKEITLLEITIGAEEATTDTFVTLIGYKWLAHNLQGIEDGESADLPTYLINSKEHITGLKEWLSQNFGADIVTHHGSIHPADMQVQLRDGTRLDFNAIFEEIRQMNRF